MKKVIRALYLIIGFVISIFICQIVGKDKDFKDYVNLLVKDSGMSKPLVYLILGILYAIAWPIVLIIAIISYFADKIN